MQHRPRALSAILALAALLVVLVAGCGSDDDASTSTSAATTEAAAETTASTGAGSADALPAQYRDKGSISVVTAIGNPPYASVEEGSSEPVGFDIDLINALAEELGTKADIQVIAFPAIVPGLESGRYDAAISSLTITPERTATLDLLAYLEIGTGLLVPTGNPAGITDLASACGKKVGVSKGSANEIPLREAQKDCDTPIEIVQTEGNDFVALQSGRVDAMALDAAAALATAEAQPDTFESAGPDVYGAGVAGIGFSKEKADLAEAFKTALEALIANGTYDEILAKWGIEDLGYTDTAINPEPAA